jgi:hypothetical protein
LPESSSTGGWKATLAIDRRRQRNPLGREADEAVNDYDLLNSQDVSHRYYRRSPKVRADIAAVMRNDPNLAGGPIQL